MLCDTPEGGFWIEIELLGRLEPLDQYATVPGAPTGIVGVTELRGRVLTLLDPFAWLLDHQPSPFAPTPRPGHLSLSALIFAAPYQHLALLVPAGSTLRSDLESPHQLKLLSAESLAARVEQLSQVAVAKT
jgi:hypothetical protein